MEIYFYNFIATLNCLILIWFVNRFTCKLFKILALAIGDNCSNFVTFGYFNAFDRNQL